MRDRFSSGELGYTVLSDTTVRVTDCAGGQRDRVTIPATVAHRGTVYQVTEIGCGDISAEQYAFQRCSELVHVDIPDSVTEIGDYAFKGCTGLTSVTIPDSVTEIGDEAFMGCTALVSITIPDSATKIGERVLEDCVGLKVFQAADGLRAEAEEDNTDHLVRKIARREINIESLADVDESLPVDWQRVLEALVASYFKRAENRVINRWYGYTTTCGTTVAFLRHTLWFARQDWVTSLQSCANRAGGARGVMFEYGQRGSDSEFQEEYWLPSDLRVIEMLYDAGARCSAFGREQPSGGQPLLPLEQRGDVRFMMMYGQADVVKAIFRREGFDASVVKVTQWMIDRVVGSGNGSALRWVFEMHPETAGLVKDSISKLFKEHRYSIFLALVEQRDSFKSSSADMYVRHFASENDTGAVRVLLDKGTVTKANAPKVESALKDIKNEAAALVRDYVAGLFDEHTRPAASGHREAGGTLLRGDVRTLNKELVKAVRVGDIEAVTRAMAEGAQPSMIEDIVLVAVRQGSRDVLEALLAAKVKPTAEALIEAAEKNDVEIAALLLKHKASIATKVQYPNTWGANRKVPVLGYAVAAESVDVVRLMLDSGQKIPPVVATAALNQAALTGNMEIAELLFAAIPEFEHVSLALGIAVKHGHPDMAVLLASKGGKLSDPGDGVPGSNLLGSFFGEGLYQLAGSGGYSRKSRESWLTREVDREGDSKRTVSEEERLRVMIALEEAGLLTDADKSEIYARALLYDDGLVFVRKLDEWGVRVARVFSSRLRTDGRERVYSMISDYLEPDQDEMMARFIFEHLEDGEVVRIRSSWLRPSRGQPDVEFLVQVLSHSGRGRCDNNTELMRILAAADRADALALMESWGVFTPKNLEEAIKIALDSQATQSVAFLLDCSQRLSVTGGDLQL